MSEEVDNFVLKLGGKVGESCGVSADTNDEVLVIVGVSLSALQVFYVCNVTLEYMAALLEEGHKDCGNGFVREKGGV